MPDHRYAFSEEQWAFLSVLEVFNTPVPIELVGNLAPLLPGPLFDLLEIAEGQGWIKKIGSKKLAIGEQLPPFVRRKLAAINSHERISDLMDRIRVCDLEKQMDLHSRIQLLLRAGRVREAGELEIDLAHRFFKDNDYERGRILLLQAVTRLYELEGDLEAGPLFIKAVLQFSSMSFALGKSFETIEKFLHKSNDVSVELGDRRSRALTNLHMGRLYYFTDRAEEALVALSIGVDEIEELGDGDIYSQSAIFLGIYFFIQGKFEQAFEYLEKANQLVETSENFMFKDPIVPVFFAYCAVYLGQFHRAIGYLDFHTRLALERSDKALSSTIRSILGTVLTLLRKDREAEIHLEKAQKEARDAGNALGLYFCGGGIALNHFLKGDVKKAHETFRNTLNEGARVGFVRQFSSPFVLEMLYEFDQRGYEPIPFFDLTDVMKRVMDGVNCHLQGACFRLKAKMSLARSGSHMEISDLPDQKRRESSQIRGPCPDFKDPSGNFQA